MSKYFLSPIDAGPVTVIAVTPVLACAPELAIVEAG
jgi:hypothetical protein